MPNGMLGPAIVSGQIVAAVSAVSAASGRGARIDPVWERDFFVRLQRGEIEQPRGQEIVLKQYEWLVQRLVWPFTLRTPRDEWESLRQSGRIGLLLAAPRFEPERGFRFSSYAKDYVLNEVRQQFHLIVGSVNSSPEIRRMMAIAHRMAEESGVFPNARQLAAEGGGSEQRALEIMLVGATHMVPLDAQVRDGDQLLHEVVGVDAAYDEALDSALLQGVLNEALQQLKSKERQVIELLYGLGNGGDSGRKRSKIAQDLKMSVSQLQLLERNALRELRRFYQERVGKGLDLKS